MSRGDRLHDEKRIKKKITKMVKETWCKAGDTGELLSPKNIGRMAHTPHSCSCRCCGNPRKYEKGVSKLTKQEQKQKEKDKI